MVVNQRTTLVCRHTTDNRKVQCKTTPVSRQQQLRNAITAVMQPYCPPWKVGSFQGGYNVFGEVALCKLISQRQKTKIQEIDLINKWFFYKPYVQTTHKYTNNRKALQMFCYYTLKYTQWVLHLCVCVCVGVGMYVHAHTHIQMHECAGHSTTWKSCFFPSTMWALRVRVRVSGLAASPLLTELSYQPCQWLL